MYKFLYWTLLLALSCLVFCFIGVIAVGLWATMQGGHAKEVGEYVGNAGLGIAVFAVVIGIGAFLLGLD